MVRPHYAAVVAIALGFATLAAQVLQSPYSLIMPGGVFELGPRISVPAEHRRDAGWLAMTAVRVRKASYADWLLAPLDSTTRVVPTNEVRPEGVGDREYYGVRTRLMASSKSIAALVALRRAGYPVEVGVQGALIERVIPGSPGSSVLEAGDIVLALNGRPVDGSAELGSLLLQRSVGEEILLELLRDDSRHQARLRLAPTPNNPSRPMVGVRTSTIVAAVRLPFEVEVDAGNVVGPSAGLMFSLALFDALTAGDLTGGQRIAGSGTLQADGRVGPVGSIAEKVVAAEREQVSLFLAPQQNAADAGASARHARVVSVGSFDEALAALLAAGGSFSAASPPSAARASADI